MSGSARSTIPTPGHPCRAELAGRDRGRDGSWDPFRARGAALKKFGGIRRRFEIKGEAAGRIVLDDYAHHPAEVRATLAAARGIFKRRVVAVFQPHRYTRLRDLFDEFLTAFDDADVLYLIEVYPAGEEPIADVSVAPAVRGACARAVISRCTTSVTRMIPPRGLRWTRAPAM